MFGIVVGIFAAVIGAAIAFGLWSLLPDTWRAARAPVSIVAAILVGLGASQLELPERRQNVDDQFEARLLNSPRVGAIARAFKESDPVEFARFIRTGDLYRRTEGDAEALERAEGAIVIVGRQRYAYLSDDDMGRRFILWRDELLALSETDPARCQLIHAGNAHAFDLLFLDHEDLNRRELELFAAAFAAAPRVHEPMSDDEYLARITEINRRLVTVVGNDALLLGPAAPVVGNEVRYCQVAAELYNQMAQTPELTRLHVAAESRGGG